MLSQHLGSVTSKPSWMNSPAAVLPPPPPAAKLSAVHQPAAPVTLDPWQSSAEPNQRAFCPCHYTADMLLMY